MQNRLFAAISVILLACLGVSITLYFLSDNIVFFITPSEITDKHYGKKIRIGGLVENNSIAKYDNGITLFILKDSAKKIKIKHKGILPALFRENQGIVAEGVIENNDSIFHLRKTTYKT
ncbi:MAG UNVERIFIED_CONTAM: cytochrome c maturation protein CcmE [Rickettsiaceae bacterium]